MVSSIFEKLKTELFRVAENDNVISDDEQALIDNILPNIEKYLSIIDQQMTKDDSTSIAEQRRKIMDDAVEIARKDDNISKEEFNLLVVLRIALNKI